MENVEEILTINDIWSICTVYFDHCFLILYKSCKQQLRRLRFVLNEVFIIPLIFVCLVGGIYLSIIQQGTEGLNPEYNVMPLMPLSTSGIFTAEGTMNAPYRETQIC